MSTLVLDDNGLKSLANNSAAVNHFPILQTLKTQITKAGSKGCGCGGNQSKVDFESVRRSLASMSVTDKTKLKELVGVSRISFSYVVGSSILTESF